MSLFKKHRLTTTQIIVFGFLTAIVLGTILLMFPFVVADGTRTHFIDALFTATSAICVTGLTTVTTATHWNFAGQLIILLLIQFGGLGVVTFATSVLLIMGKKITLQNRLLIQESYNLENLNGLVILTIRIIKGTLLVEAGGAVFYSFIFIPEYGLMKGIWFSIFHGISSFCNAGFDLIGPTGFFKYQTNPLINLVTMALIIGGGIGFPVWWDILHNAKLIRKGKVAPKRFFKKLNVHSKLTIIVTIFLILFGALFIFINEYSNPGTIGTMSFFNKIMASFFQSITFRTAGYATIPQEQLTTGSALVGIIMMFIGGSPSGTAGGVKTVTMAILILGAISGMKGRSDIELFERKIIDAYVKKALAVFFFSLTTLMVSAVALSTVIHLDLVDILYECVSALGTVGLSRNITGNLNIPGKAIIIITMYLGRIGPISLALALNVSKHKACNIEMASSRVIIG